MNSLATFLTVIAQMSPTAMSGASSGGAMGYRPFLMPLPLWDYWYVMVLPLCLGVSIVYKSIKCNDLADVPKQAITITIWILGGMAAAALALALIVKIL